MAELMTAKPYRWCAACGAAIAAKAEMCRFCRKSIGKVATVAENLGGARTCAAATRWLSEFPQFVDSLPFGTPLKRLLLIALEQQTQEMRSEPAIDALIGYQLPPEPHVADLIKLVVLQSAGSPVYTRLIGHPRLQLLELSHGEIVQERSLLERECEGGRCCPHCAECNLPSAEYCRFCGTAEGEPFAPASQVCPQLDDRFLRLMIVHIAAWTRIESQQMPYLDDAIRSNGISESEIATEEGRLNSSFCPSYEQELPLSTWENRLITCEQTHTRTQYAAVHNLIELAKACRMQNRFEEAHLLLKFVTSVIFRNETDEFLRDFMLTECGDEQTQLGAAAPNLDDAGARGGPLEAAADLANAWNETACDYLASSSTNTDLIAKLMNGTEEERVKAIDSLKDGMKAATDAITEMLSQRCETGELASIKNSMLKQMMESATEALDATSFSVRARGAFSRGEYATAEQLARRALSELSGDSSLVVHQRAIQLCFLAEIYTGQNKVDEAVPLLDDAVEQAGKLPGDDCFHRNLIYRQVAAGFEKLGHLERAKEFYERAIEQCEYSILELRTKFSVDVPMGADLGSLFSVYSGVLRKLGLQAEAAAAEARARDLRGV